MRKLGWMPCVNALGQLKKIVLSSHSSQEEILSRAFINKPKKTLGELIRYITPMYTGKSLWSVILNCCTHPNQTRWPTAWQDWNQPGKCNFLSIPQRYRLEINAISFEGWDKTSTLKSSWRNSSPLLSSLGTGLTLAMPFWTNLDQLNSMRQEKSKIFGNMASKALWYLFKDQLKLLPWIHDKNAKGKSSVWY